MTSLALSTTLRKVRFWFSSFSPDDEFLITRFKVGKCIYTLVCANVLVEPYIVGSGTIECIRVWRKAEVSHDWLFHFTCKLWFHHIILDPKVLLVPKSKLQFVGQRNRLKFSFLPKSLIKTNRFAIYQISNWIDPKFMTFYFTRI